MSQDNNPSENFEDLLDEMMNEMNIVDITRLQGKDRKEMFEKVEQLLNMLIKHDLKDSENLSELKYWHKLLSPIKPENVEKAKTEKFQAQTAFVEKIWTKSLEWELELENQEGKNK